MNGRLWTIGAAALLVAGAIAFGRPWIALGLHASSYPVTGAGEAANVAIDGDTAFVSRAERGVEIVDVASGKSLAILPPPRGSESVDDLAVAGGFLFLLDARTPGHLSVLSLANRELVSPPVPVAVGPFSGVSAGGGRVIVSGGTSRMELRAYDAGGRIGPLLATNDFGRGQPDVLLAPDGKRAFVSTHYWGPYFGLTTVHVSASLAKGASVDLDTYGFTDGGAKPASFPLKTALAGEVLLAADAGGLHLFTADVDAPKPLAHLDLGFEAVNVDARGTLAAVVGSAPRPQLALVDIASPSSPRIVRKVPLPEGSYPTGVAIGASRVAVATHHHGVLFIPR